MEREDIIVDILEAARNLHSRKLWKRFTNDDCFGVRIVSENEVMLGVVLGFGGEQYGLTLFRGPDATDCLVALLDTDGQGDDALDEMDILGFSMDTFGDLPPEAQAFMRDAGQHCRYEDQVPSFLAKPAGCLGRLPNDQELALLLVTLRSVVKADKKKLLQPTVLEDPEGICVINVSGSATEPQIHVTRERLEQKAKPTTIRLVTTSHDLGGLPRLNTTWLVGMPAIPGAVKGDDRTMQLLLVVDDANELVLQGKPIFSGDMEEAADTLTETFIGKGLSKIKGLPREIIFSSRKLHDAMNPILEPLNVKCIYAPSIPRLLEITAKFSEFVESDFLPFDDDAENFDVSNMEVPAPDDLEGWKEVDNRLFDRFIEYFDFEDRLWSSRAVKRYFGQDDLEFYMQEHEQRGVVAAYTAWGILDYRPNRNSKTHAEKMLKEGLPNPEAILLQARMDTWPTLYRVAGHNPRAGTVSLEDILLGGTVTVHDQLLSENIDDNLFLLARTFPAGTFQFIEMAGPPLGVGMGMGAVDFLRQCGLKFTPDDLCKNAHIFGRLWQWVTDWQANWKPPLLRNTDGHELLWHTASFSLEDPNLIRRRLTQRKDIEHDEDSDELVWNKATGNDNKMLGETITLGRIEFVGDELIVTVNSGERFATARKWLDKLPGVIFNDVQTRRFDTLEEDRPMDERISPPESLKMTPELASSIQEMLTKRYMEWLDTPLPTLEGKTPRQACKTDAGRQEVVMLIRTIPDPIGPAPVRVPREAMLYELGLQSESPSTKPTIIQNSQFPIPIEEISPERKVSRNAPCPCGSGTKYKKCCGR